MSHRGLKNRDTAKPIAKAPTTKKRDADACRASSIRPRLNSTIISNAAMPGIMMTVGATIMPRRDTLRRWSVTKATSPISKAAKNAAGAGIMPGVTAFVPRDASSDRLVSAVQSAARGELLCSPKTAAVLFERVGALSRQGSGGPAPPVPFSERELQIGRLLAEGLVNKEIAVRLRIEVATVKNHVRRILAKLRVTNRGLAAEYFRAAPG